MVGTKALLIEVVRRAAYDWVLYRQDSRPSYRGMAMDAYVWLFQEEPGHTLWEERRDRGELGMSFLGICESLGLDPGAIRDGICKLTPHRIRTLGRIPTNRSKKTGCHDSLFGEDLSMVADFPSELKEAIEEPSEDAEMDDDVKMLLGMADEVW